MQTSDRKKGVGIKDASATSSEIRNIGPTSALESLMNAEIVMTVRIIMNTPCRIMPRCLGGGKWLLFNMFSFGTQ